MNIFPIFDNLRVYYHTFLIIKATMTPKVWCRQLVTLYPQKQNGQTSMKMTRISVSEKFYSAISISIVMETCCIY